MNLLTTLKKQSIIVADTEDIQYIQKYKPQDVTTNPSLIFNASQNKNYQHLFCDSIQYSKNQCSNIHKQSLLASEKFAVNVGTEILKTIPGRVSTEIDACLSFNTNLTIKKAYNIINLYKKNNIDIKRVFIKIIATWEGIKAAEILEKNNINCNMTLIFSLAQAYACAEANVSIISPFVGRINDWYKKNNISYQNNIQINNKNINYLEQGVKFVYDIYNYYKKHNYKTNIMAASLRTIDQILILAGCDALTIPPNLLNKLYSSENNNNKNTILPILTKSNILEDENTKLTKPYLNKSNFHWMHNQNAMAVEKLSEGIRNFAIDQKKLINLCYKHL